jgi:hypothetical protein
MATAIVRAEIDGVEFFVLTSGESGMSISGLARLCGVTQQALSKMLQSVPTSSCPEFLKCLQEVELMPTTNNVTFIHDQACATILEWYAFESRRTTDKARTTYRKFAQAGIRTWIQHQTGWQPEKVETKQSEPIRLNECSPDDLMALYEYRLAIEEGRTPDERSVEHIDLNYLQADLHNISLTFARGMLHDDLRTLNIYADSANKKFLSEFKKRLQRRKNEVTALEKGSVPRLQPTWDATALLLTAGK